MKNRVVAKKVNDKIKFYLKNDEGENWLFTQTYTPEVYDWFRNGRSENEILQFNGWKKDKKLVNTVQRIPREIKYVIKYVIGDDMAG